MLRRLRCRWIGCVVARLQAGQGRLVCRDCGRCWRVKVV